MRNSPTPHRCVSRSIPGRCFISAGPRSSIRRHRPPIATTRSTGPSARVLHRASWRAPASSCRPSAFRSKPGASKAMRRPRSIERRVEAAHDSDTLDATLVVEPGAKAAYGTTTVQGTDRMDPAFRRLHGRSAGRPGIRSRRHQASQHAAGAARRVSRAADRGRRRHRGGRVVADQRHRAGAIAAGASASAAAIRRWMAPASRHTGCIATCSARPSGCASTPRSPASAATSATAAHSIPTISPTASA